MTLKHMFLKMAMRLLFASAFPAISMLAGQDAPDRSTPPEPQPGQQASLPGNSPGTSPFAGPLKPLTVGGKAKEILEPAFGPRAIATTAVVAGIRLATVPDQYPHDWRAGAEGYGHSYADSFARSSANALGRFSAAAILHEDPRYRRSDSTAVMARIGHALAYTFVDTTDGGRKTIAFSNFAGAAAEGFIGSGYLPRGYDDLTHAGQRSLSAFAPVGAQNLLQEFAPELGRVLQKMHLPRLPLIPVWWAKEK